MGTLWEGILAPLDESTGDGRRILSAGLTFRDLPLPLKYQPEDVMGHDESVIVGSIDSIEMKDGTAYGKGEFFDDADPVTLPDVAKRACEAVYLTEKQTIGPSVDAGACSYIIAEVGSDEPITDERFEELWIIAEQEGGDLPIETVFSEYEIAGATLVGIPAFSKCRPLALDKATESITASVRTEGWSSLPFAPRDMQWDESAADVRISDDCGIGGDNPDWQAFADAHLYKDDEADPQTKGAYKFLICDIVDGDRVIVPRGVFTTAAVLEGSMGGTNIPEADQDTMRGVVSSIYKRMADEFDDPEIVAPWDAQASITAAEKYRALSTSDMPPLYDATMFEPVRFGRVTPITVTADGRVFGHVATHDVCHVGMRDTCTTAPVDDGGFEAFHRYDINIGPLVGRLTYGGGQHPATCQCCRGHDDHACDRLSSAGAIAHHDTMRTVAYVRAWEDQENNAIAVAGVLAATVEDEDIQALSRGRVSGDWRSDRGKLALVEVLTLARERPGFPLPTGRMASNGEVLSLTAAGTVIPPKVLQPAGTLDEDALATRIARTVTEMLTSAGLVPASGKALVADNGLGHHDDDATAVDVEADAASALLAEIQTEAARADGVTASRLAREIGV
jgi:hypothetical protein